MKHFEDYCREHFQYLITDLGFEPLIFLEESGRFESTIVMQTKNNTTAIKLYYEHTDTRLDLILTRLDAQGAIPKSERTFYYDPLNPKDQRRKLYEGVKPFYFHIADILGELHPDALPALETMLRNFCDDSDTLLEAGVQMYAEVLQKYCGHILKGNFSEYDQIHKFQEARIEKDTREFEEAINTPDNEILESMAKNNNEIRTVKLQKEESDFLNSHLKGYSFREGKNVVPETQCKVLFETLIDLFLTIGLDEEDEATKLGCFIEDLAFKFFVEDAFLP